MGKQDFTQSNLTELDWFTIVPALIPPLRLQAIIRLMGVGSRMRGTGSNQNRTSFDTPTWYHRGWMVLQGRGRGFGSPLQLGNPILPLGCGIVSLSTGPLGGFQGLG